MRFLLFSLLVLCSYQICQSQSPITFGVKAGVNYSSYTPRYISPPIKDLRYAGKFGYYLGGVINLELSYKFQLQGELQYAKQGTRYKNKNIEIINDEFSQQIVSFESNFNEHTLTIPIVLRYLANDYFAIEVGPQFGYIFSLREHIIRDDLNVLEDRSLDGYDKFDFGCTVGASYGMTDHIHINGRYFFGLIERNNHIKSSVFNLGLSYYFN